MIGLLPEGIEGVVGKNLFRRPRQRKPGFDICPHFLGRIEFIDSVVGTDPLKEVRPLWMFESSGKFVLPGKNHREEVSSITLHIRKQAEVLQVDGGNSICLVDENQYFSSFCKG